MLVIVLMFGWLVCDVMGVLVCVMCVVDVVVVYC